MDPQPHPVSDPMPRCAKYARALGRQRVDLRATGGRANNDLVRLLVCESGRSLCRDAVAAHAACHAAVMGVGAFEGRRDCGAELAALRACVAEARGGPR